MNKVRYLMSSLCLALCAWSAAVPAADKPDGLALLKSHPEFVTITKITSLGDQTATVHMTLCRSKHQAVNCELFEGKADAMEAMADYVYLYANYQGKYDKTASGKPAKSLADGLLKEAADKGYARDLLDHYARQYACSGAKDMTACTLHHLFVSTVSQRYIMERSGHQITLLEADEDGSGDVFES